VSERFLVGLDLGGGGVRCLLVDPAGGRVVGATRAWSSAPVPAVPMGIEYDAEGTWKALCGVVREAFAKAGAPPAAALAIAATSMRHGSALLDAEGRELLLAPNRDARGAPAAIQLALQHGAELHRRTGHWPNAVQPGARLRWFATNARETLERAATHLSLSDWIAFRLCGERAAEPSQASETLLCEIARPAWAEDWIERLELPRRLFPELRPAGSRLGGLTPAAAEALGLPAGLPVALGGGDTQCGLLGAGVLAPGQLGIVAGSSAPVLQLTRAPVLDPEGRLWTVHHALPGGFALESNAGGLGEGLAWIAGLLHPTEAHPILHFLADASRAPHGSAGLLSTLGAEVMDARSFKLPVGNLTVNYLTSAGDPDRRRHLARSVAEGMAFALRANAEQVESDTRTVSPRVRLTGGVARSALVGQLLADVFDRPVEVAEASVDATALGAAMCAGVGAGTFASFEQAAGALARVARTFEPRPPERDFYAQLYAGWNEVRRGHEAADARASTFAIGALIAGAGAAEQAPRAFRPKILVTADLDEEGLAALREIGDVEFQSFRKAMRLLTGTSLAAALEGVHVLVTEVDVVDAAALLRARDLRLLAVCRGDAVNVDLAACTALGIPVVHTPGRNADAVADLTLAFLLMLARKLPQADAFLRQPGGEPGDMGRMGQAFGRLQGRELWRKTIGLVGLGAVGRKVAERLRPFGARCLAHDPYQADDAVRLAGAEPASLEQLLAESDFVSLHAPVTDATRGLIGAQELARMRPGSFLVNTARAALVDEAALVEALRSGHLAGAAVDVFAVEPPGSDDPLLQLENVIATPHVGGNTREVAAHQGRIVAEELARVRAGRAPRFAINRETLEGFDWSQPRKQPPADLRARLERSAGPAVTDIQRDRKRRAGEPGGRAARGEQAVRAAGGEQVERIREAMEKIVAAFVGDVADDAALTRFAKSAPDVTLHFTLSDLGTHFHLGFRDGRAFGAMGAPEDDADTVRLKLSADLFDGMLTGRRNAMQAAMEGELSFSGDTAKAMTLQQINADMSRLYRAARERVGDPGDLASLPRPGAAARPAPARPAAAAAPAPASSVPAGDVRFELCRIVDELFAAELITATGGNVSARIPEHTDQAWITPSQLFKGDLSPEILVRIDMHGRALDEDARSPSSEALMHTAVLAAKPEARAVIHCHAPNATILVNSGLPFLPISTEAAFFRNIGRIPFVMPGTEDLARAVVEAMGDGWAVLMQNHGLLVAGRTLRRAADMAEIIERTCQVILGCYAVGREPPVLPEKTVEMLSKYGDLMA
jgi:autoinducer 2 (AI-2) kinase